MKIKYVCCTLSPRPRLCAKTASIDEDSLSKSASIGSRDPANQLLQLSQLAGHVHDMYQTAHDVMSNPLVMNTHEQLPMLTRHAPVMQIKSNIQSWLARLASAERSQSQPGTQSMSK